MIGQIAATVFTAPCGGCGGYAYAAYYTYLQTGSANATLRTVAISYLTNSAFSGVADESFVVRAAVKVGVTAVAARIQGGDWRRAARLAFFTELAREFWTYTEGETDRLYAAACKEARNCKYDEFGAQTDGARSVLVGINDGEWSRVPKLLKSYLTGGMAKEGSGAHLYDPGGWLCSVGETLCSGIRQFVRQVSKPHDWGNSWAYDTTGQSGFLGWRIEGGGYESIWARVTYETAVQTWSFITMPVMTGFTGVAIYGDYINLSHRSRYKP